MCVASAGAASAPGIYEHDAELYDAAFSWDVTSEVNWMISRLGNPSAILEPFCGSGRLFSAFAQRSVRVFGVERSARMAGRAHARLERLGLSPTVLVADAADFNLSPLTTDPLDGAICPINSFSHLSTKEQALAHLHSVARHLRSGASYLVQLDIRDPDDHTPSETIEWEALHGRRRVLARWEGVSYDPRTRLETQESCVEVIDGPDAGRIARDEHTMLLWDLASWEALVDASPFEIHAVYDGHITRRPPVPLDPEIRHGTMLWHELALAG